MKNANVSIFVPHNGCPNQCSFCNQKNITGQAVQPSVESVRETLEAAKSKIDFKQTRAEIAFFGGSFTAIDRDYMVELLNEASRFLGKGSFEGIRISTRPDAIDDEIVDILRDYGVKTVELGAQSMCDSVLSANKRGHTREDVILSSKKIKAAGFKLGLQMMTGLYTSNESLDIKTAEEFIKLKPDMVRIYPTVVMKGTELETLYNSGVYEPAKFESTVELCSFLLNLFERKNNIPVIRLGLHDSESLRKNMVSGVFHPAFSEVCESNLIFHEILAQIKKLEMKSGNITVKINSRDISKAVGQKRVNLKKFKDLGYNINFVFCNEIKLGKVFVSV